MAQVYLDYNCFQRSFDDMRQTRIFLEAISCQSIFKMAEDHKIDLIWSFMHQDESILCPFPDRKIEAFKLSQLCRIKVKPSEDIRMKAIEYQKKASLSTNDAIHLASAVSSASDFFITCDDELIKRSGRLNLSIKIMNPVDYYRGVIRNE